MLFTVFWQNLSYIYSITLSNRFFLYRFPARQEIPLILWNSKIITESTSVQFLSQRNPIHTPTFYFLKIHFNTILPSMIVLPNCLFPSGFPTKTICTPLVPPYALQTSPILLFSNSPTPKFLVKNIGHQASHYIVFPLPYYLVPLNPKYFP